MTRAFPQAQDGTTKMSKKNSELMKKHGLDFPPSTPTGTARARQWDYTTDQFQQLLDLAMTLKPAKRKELFADYHVSSLAVLRNQEGVVDRRPTSSDGTPYTVVNPDLLKKNQSESVPLSKDETLAKMEAKIASLEAELKKVKAAREEFVKLDENMMSVIAELQKL